MLVEDAIEKVKNGLTTLNELIRVIGPQTKLLPFLQTAA